MKPASFLLALLLPALRLCAQTSTEVWAYLYKGEKKFFPASSPITDVACFSASVDGDGNVIGGHQTPPDLPAQNLRYHLVVTIPYDKTLAHIYLNPELPLRNRIIAQIVDRSKSFDGVQIDFESIAPEDGTHYLNFLSDLKRALPQNKIFSVAVMARWAAHKKAHPSDAFDYPFINLIADRVIVMAYDEHYGGGSAGPIASLPWCEKIYAHATATIDPGKLIMGIPLYGRSWQTEKTAQAYRNPAIWTDLRARNLIASSDPAIGGSYSYTTTVTINVYFENLPSLNAKINLYRTQPTRGLAFWRIGQEPLDFWKQLGE